MKIDHRPLIDIEKVCKFYTEKDGALVTYVCTTALGGGTQAMDIFYRETPHPEFGNKYFGLFYTSSGLRITNADKVEDLTFDMIQDSDGTFHYSQHRHDFHTVGDTSIDGGRDYTRKVGNVATPVQSFVVRSGLLHKMYEDDVV